MKTLKCKECGRSFEYPRKKDCCSTKCRDLNLRRRKFGIRQCEQCGKDYIPKRETSRFCSEVCTLDYGRYVLQGREKAEEIPCPVCGKLFRAIMDRGKRRQYCSKECYVAVQPLVQSFERVCMTCGTKYLTAEGYSSEYCSEGCKKAAFTLTCTICGKEYEAQNRNQVVCGEECRKEKDRLCSIESYCKKDRHKNKTVIGKCKKCGKQFINKYGEKRRIYCSDKCSKAHSKKLRSKKFKAKVFERDGWICQICGEKINKTYYYPHPKSASVDHIIPVSLGGPDELYNMQAAHLICNIMKGNNPSPNGDQLRLA